MDYIQALARATSSAIRSAHTTFTRELYTGNTPPPPVPTATVPAPATTTSVAPLSPQDVQRIRQHLLAPRRPAGRGPMG